MFRVVINPEVMSIVNSVAQVDFRTREQAEEFMEAFGGIATEVAGLLGRELPEDISTLKVI
jgi:hypothetical protein